MGDFYFNFFRASAKYFVLWGSLCFRMAFISRMVGKCPEIVNRLNPISPSEWRRWLMVNFQGQITNNIEFLTDWGWIGGWDWPNKLLTGFYSSLRPNVNTIFIGRGCQSYNWPLYFGTFRRFQYCFILSHSLHKIHLENLICLFSSLSLSSENPF